MLEIVAFFGGISLTAALNRLDASARGRELRPTALAARASCPALRPVCPWPGRSCPRPTLVVYEDDVGVVVVEEQAMKHGDSRCNIRLGEVDNAGAKTGT